MVLFVMSIDPGKTTGYALLAYEPSDNTVDVKETAELTPEEFGEKVEQVLRDESVNCRLLVCCESFIINAQTVRNSQAPYSLEQIGVLKYLCYSNGYDPAKIAFQAPVNAKNMFPNPVLKQLGTWHRGGAGHANDAIRHGLLRLVKDGWVPRALLEDT
jgi:hypothetical protein